MLDLPFLTSCLIIGAFFIGHWYFSLFTQSFFHHRFAAHRQFSMGKGWQKFFYLLSYVAQGSSYLSPRTYAIMHRQHHAHTDTEQDPHSPSFMPSLFNMMWRTKNYYTALHHNEEGVEPKFLQNLPDWKRLDELGHTWASRLTWMALYTIFYMLFATEWWMYLALPIHFIMGPFHGAIINWFAHKIGYVNYRMRNTSTNLINIDLVMWGESLHNNHHRHPSRANFATRWFEFDPMFSVIKTMHWLGIVQLPKGARA